jgi:mono/diheme cytochrome c family protein
MQARGTLVSGWLALGLAACAWASAADLAQAAETERPAQAAADETDGRAIYADACAACHGEDGRGRTATAIDVPLPDFTDCQIATSEPDSNWLPLIAHGGTALGLSTSMPAFDGALTPEQQRAVLAYVRSFCADPAWPRGDLNFPRPIFFDKAFPEDEFVLSPTFVEARDAREIGGELAYEHRVGARGQIEAALPALLSDVKHGGPTAGGLGDLALAYKQVVYAGLEPRAIAALATDLVLPTGEPTKETGAGTVAFEPALLGGAAFAGFILQAQLRAELPIDVDRAPRVMLYRVALQYPLGAMRRSLVPALELESAQRIEGDFHDATVLGPTFYVPLSLRGHVALGLGAQVPVSAYHPFDYRVGAILLWDYLDGPLW